MFFDIVGGENGGLDILFSDQELPLCALRGVDNLRLPLRTDHLLRSLGVLFKFVFRASTISRDTNILI
jgi:hypothetical protein